MFSVAALPRTRQYVGSTTFNKLLRHYCKEQPSLCPQAAVPPPKGGGGNKKWFLILGVATLLGGAIAYAKKDPEFRTLMVEVVPQADGIIKFLYEEDMTYYESVATAFTELSQNVVPELKVQKDKIMDIIMDKVEPEFRLRKDKLTEMLCEVSREVHNKVQARAGFKSLQNNEGDEDIPRDTCPGDHVLTSSFGKDEIEQRDQCLEEGSGEAMPADDELEEQTLTAAEDDCSDCCDTDDLLEPAVATTERSQQTNIDLNEDCPIEVPKIVDEEEEEVCPGVNKN